MILAALFVLRGDKTRRVVRFRLHYWEHYLVRLPKELGEFLVGDTHAMRLERVDVLRGIAILLVVGHHMPINSGAFMLWRHVGWIGVDLFFVLSGFLVSGLLFAEYQRHGTLSIARFLARRGLKIYPSFYTLLSLTVAYYAFVTSGWVAPRTPLPDLAARATAEAVYLGNYLPSVWGHTWSLAVEEHFYFMLAGGFVLLVRYRRANPFAALVPIVALTVLGVTALRVFTWANYPYTFKTHLSVTHLRFDALAIGVLLSYAYHYHREALLASVLRWRYALAVAAALLIATPFAWADGALAPFGLLSFSLGFAVVLALTLTRTQRPPLAGRVIATVGVYSYSIYLWHPAVERMVARLSLSTLPVFVLYMGASIVLGVVMAKLIERPALAMRDRLFPSRAKA